MSRKVAVIGGGLAGSAAAANARKAGAEVVMLSRGPGATAFSSGALDCFGDPCPPTLRPDSAQRDAAKNLERLLLVNPAHPYSRMTGDEPDAAFTRLRELLSGTLDLLFPEGGGLALAGELESSTPLFTSLGTIKFTNLHPANMAGPDQAGSDRPLVIGVHGLNDFDPELWTRTARQNTERLGKKLSPICADIVFDGRGERQSPELAAQVEAAPEQFINAVGAAKDKAREASCLILPPVLPLGPREKLMSELAGGFSLPVYEVLSLPPSVPGLRLFEHLEKRVAALGIELMRAEAVGFDHEAGRVKSLVVRQGGEESRLEAHAFVLAGGKFIAGGLEKKRAFREKLFGLPIYLDDRIVDEIFIEKVLGRGVNDRHPLFEAGLKNDERLRPINREGLPAYENLFAAGAVLAGYNYLRDGTGAGVALAAGAQAGINAARPG